MMQQFETCILFPDKNITMVFKIQIKYSCFMCTIHCYWL